MVAEWCGRAVAGRVGARLRAQPGVTGAARERRERRTPAAARARAQPRARLAPRRRERQTQTDLRLHARAHRRHPGVPNWSVRDPSESYAELISKIIIVIVAVLALTRCDSTTLMLSPVSTD